jgi:putative flippase GtrA
MPADTFTEMPAEEMSTAVVELPFHHRVRIGISSGENWLQLIRFGVVGCSGYAVNLIVFAACVHVLAIDYKLASPIAYLAGTINNFIWNRRWTFGHAKEAHPVGQGVKFFIVSLVSFGVNYGILVGLVHSSGMDKVLAQAIANICGIPINFLGQKLWSFKK